jgi:hypothetical protein
LGKIIVFSKYIVFVFSSDINEKRKHVHVRDKAGKLNSICKFWIEPRVKMEYNYGFKEVEVNEIQGLLSDNLTDIKKQLDKFYAGKKVKSINL